MIGDHMPDIPLGKVLNNHTGKQSFGDFKGKLIILDFWNTYCSNCIEAFPKIEELQKKYGDHIQILLVNQIEDEQAIKARVKKGNLTEFFPKNVPSIVDATQLGALFPGKGATGYHIWIDKSGVVRFRGDGETNTYSKKVEDFLAGRTVDFLTDIGGVTYQKERPFYSYVDQSPEPIVLYHSLFTHLSDDIASIHGAEAKEVVDTTANTLRNTRLNMDLIELYRIATEHTLSGQKILLGKHPRLLVSDSSRYGMRLPWLKDSPYDKYYRKAKYCYEQVTPLDMPESLRSQYMFEDLNRNLRVMYKAKAVVKRVKLPCYVVVKKSSDQRFLAPNRKMRLFSEKDRVRYVTYQGFTLYEIFNQIAFENLIGVKNPILDLLINESGIEGPVNFTILSPYENRLTIEIIREAFREHGLDIIGATRELNILEIKEDDYKKPVK